MTKGEIAPEPLLVFQVSTPQYNRGAHASMHSVDLKSASRANRDYNYEGHKFISLGYLVLPSLNKAFTYLLTYKTRVPKCTKS